MAIVQHDIETLTLLDLLAYTPTHLPILSPRYLSSLQSRGELCPSRYQKPTNPRSPFVAPSYPPRCPHFCRKPSLRAPK
ncbi:hypothetical protein K440DRAFT_210564 [Wilcoxina mikolae CBS 423.85]|nr:hypothetical protein K440DRAFT_210564 [Wilcoxina mikolae CBS 423.85]